MSNRVTRRAGLRRWLLATGVSVGSVVAPTAPAVTRSNIVLTHEVVKGAGMKGLKMLTTADLQFVRRFTSWGVGR